MHDSLDSKRKKKKKMVAVQIDASTNRTWDEDKGWRVCTIYVL